MMTKEEAKEQISRLIKSAAEIQAILPTHRVWDATANIIVERIFPNMEKE